MVTPTPPPPTAAPSSRDPSRSELSSGSVLLRPATTRRPNSANQRFWRTRNSRPLPAPPPPFDLFLFRSEKQGNPGPQKSGRISLRGGLLRFSFYDNSQAADPG